MRCATYADLAQLDAVSQSCADQGGSGWKAAQFEVHQQTYLLLGNTSVLSNHSQSSSTAKMVSQADLSNRIAHVLVAERKAEQRELLGFVVAWLVADELQAMHCAPVIACLGNGFAHFEVVVDQS